MKRKVVIEDLFHDVAPHGSQPNSEIINIIVAAIIAIAAVNY